MSKTASRPSLAERLAAVAGPHAAPQIAALARNEEAEPVAKPKPRAVKPVPVAEVPSEASTAKARVGKTMIAGYFTPQMAKAVKLLSVERDTTVQALIGEGLDMVLHKYGKHPMGER